MKEEGRGEQQGEQQGEAEQWRSQAVQAHGSGGTSVAHASGPQLHTAQHVGSESRSQNREPPCRSRGPDLVGICKMFVVFFFFFPLSLKLCADSHVGELIKPHVLPDGLSQAAGWGRRCLTYEAAGSLGHRPGEDLDFSPRCGFPAGVQTFC